MNNQCAMCSTDRDEAKLFGGKSFCPDCYILARVLYELEHGIGSLVEDERRSRRHVAYAMAFNRKVDKIIVDRWEKSLRYFYEYRTKLKSEYYS